MRFWELGEPEGSDYRHVRISGKLDHPYRMPGARCEACGVSVSSWTAVLPYECPTAMRQHPLLTDHEAEIPMKEFVKLAREIVRELRKAGTKKPLLNPGACLQPAYLDVPTRPTFDFLWSNLWSGLRGLVVGERVRNLLLDQAADDVAFGPVNLRRIGKGSTRSSVRVPRSGEPEDLMDRYPVASDTGVGPYYQLFVTARSGYPPGTEPGPICSTCGSELEQDWKAEDSRAQRRWRTQQEAWRNLSGPILESVWNGASIFRLAGRGTVLVAEPLKTRLEEMQVTNVAFREFPLVRPNAARKRRPVRASGR